MRRETLYRTLMLLIVCLLTGCKSNSDSEDDAPLPQQEEQAQQMPVGFAATIAGNKEGAASRMTRAAGDGELTTELLREKGFGVYCWYTGETSFDPSFPAPKTHIKDYAEYVLMQNQHVEYKNDKWTYSPSKYWPLNEAENLTFRAYAPYVSYNLQTNSHGMPMLPVVVYEDDYHNGTQHDPLWGTSKHEGDDDEGTTYGLLYNNYNYTKSGDQTVKDSRDGFIDWYFHHGMAKLMFTCSVIQDPGCEKVTIKSITITPLYDQGLLDISSPTASAGEKPVWDDKSGDMEVTLSEHDPNTEAGDLAPIPTPDPEPVDFNPYPFVIIPKSDAPTEYVQLLSKGLLIIPRDYSSTPMSVSIEYFIDNESSDVQTAVGTISKNFEGNTAYTLGLSLTPATKGLEITLAQSAFTEWGAGGTVEITEYNW